MFSETKYLFDHRSAPVGRQQYLCYGYDPYELRTGRGSIVKSAKMQLLSVSSVEWCNQSLVCYFHTQYKTHECTQPNMILLTKFHSFIVWFKDVCLDLMFALILPGSSSEITCRPGRYRGRSGQHAALI